MTRLIAFSDNEIVALRGMLDAALKSIGGQAAKAYIVLDGKLEQALQQKEPVDAPETGEVSG